MNTDKNASSRRNFIKTAGTAGVVAAAVAVGGTETVNAQEINAMQPTGEQIKTFFGSDFGGPIVMVNLLKFKPNGGAEEYAKYSEAVQPLLESVGGRVLFAGEAKFCLIGNADWDMVALAEYPNPQAMMKMVSLPEYQKIHVHREAGLEGQVNYAVVQQAGLR